MKTRKTFFDSFTRTMAVLLVGVAVFTGCSDKPVNPKGEYIPEPPVEGGNLAMNGVATSSSENADHGPALLIDGIKQDNDLYFSSSSKSADGEEWVKIRLSNEQEINEILLFPKWRASGTEGFPIRFRLEVSTNGESWTKVYETTSDYPVPPNANARQFNFPNVVAGYVRLVATKLYHVSNQWTGWQEQYVMQMDEIEVYLRDNIVTPNPDPVEPADPTGTNIAIGGSGTSTSQHETLGPELLIDGNKSTFYSSALNHTDPYTETITLKLKSKQSIHEIRLIPRSNLENFPIDFTLSVSTDNSSYTTVVTKTGYPAPEQPWAQVFAITPVEALYVKLDVTKMPFGFNGVANAYTLQLAEIEVYTNDVIVPGPDVPVNLAQGCTATSSSQHDTLGPVLLTDGVTAGGDGQFFSSVLDNGAQHTEWVKIDLGTAKTINQVWLYPRATRENFPVDFTIEVSSDDITYTTVKTVTGYTTPASVTPQKFGFTATQARYVKINVTKLPGGWNGWMTAYILQLAEVEIYNGEPIPNPDVPVNLAQGCAATSSSQHDTLGPALLVDGVTAGGDGQFFSSVLDNGAQHTEWVKIDLGTAKTINQVWLYPRATRENFPVDFTIEVSADDSAYTIVKTVTGYATPASVTPQKFDFTATQARYVKINVTKLPGGWNGWMTAYILQLAEVEIYNIPAQ